MPRADNAAELLEIVLRECAAAGGPWYPSDYADATGVDRTALDHTLDHLRIGGLIQLTEWVKGKGQGYALTPQGAEVLRKPHLLNLLRSGNVAVAIPPPPPVSERHGEPGDSHYARGERVRGALMTETRPICTYILIAFNVFIFVLPQLNAGVTRNGLFRQFDLSAENLRGGEAWWRLITYAFLHADIMHIGLNMFALFSLGRLMERLWGIIAFLIVYFVSAISGGVGHILYEADPVVGASGAICGLLGSMAVWVVLNRHHLPPELTRNWLGNILQNVILIAIISLAPGLRVSTGGHAGGAIGGALISIPLVYACYYTGWQRVAGIVGVLLICLAPVGVLEGAKLKKRMDQEALTREMEVVQEKYKLKLIKTNEIVATINTKYVQSLLSQPPRQEDDPRVAPARQAVKEKLAEVESIRKAFDEADPFTHNETISGMKAARDYMSQAAEFLRSFETCLGPPPQWDAPQRQNVLAQRKLLAARWNDCHASIVLGLSVLAGG